MLTATGKRKKNNFMISDLEEAVAEQETRLTAAEENIQGTPMNVPPIFVHINNISCCPKTCMVVYKIIQRL